MRPGCNASGCLNQVCVTPGWDTDDKWPAQSSMVAVSLSCGSKKNIAPWWSRRKIFCCCAALKLLLIKRMRVAQQTRLTRRTKKFWRGAAGWKERTLFWVTLTINYKLQTCTLHWLASVWHWCGNAHASLHAWSACMAVDVWLGVWGAWLAPSWGVVGRQPLLDDQLDVRVVREAVLERIA